MRRVLYSVFGRKLESHKWNIPVDIIDAKKLSYISIEDIMKKTDFIFLCPPSTATVDRYGDVSLKFECSGQWQFCFDKDEFYISAEAIDDHHSYSASPS